MSLFTQRLFLVQPGVQRAQGAGEGPGGGRSPCTGASLAGRCQPCFGVVFRHADDDNAASHEKTVHSLLFYMLLELGLEGYEVVRVGTQHSRQKEPPGEGGALHCSPGRSDKGAVPGHEVGLGVQRRLDWRSEKDRFSWAGLASSGPLPPHTSSMPGGPKGSRDGVPVAEIASQSAAPVVRSGRQPMCLCPP